MSLGSALVLIAQRILATPHNLGLFIGLQAPGTGTLLDFPDPKPPPSE